MTTLVLNFYVQKSIEQAYANLKGNCVLEALESFSQVIFCGSTSNSNNKKIKKIKIELF